jgi:Protein of unknown function (DUF1044).
MQLGWITFVETDVFSSRVARFALESALHDLQLELVQDPERGALDAGTGGLRKIRMPIPGSAKGKSAGVRVHYLWLEHRRRIYLMFVYGKDDQDSLSIEQKRALKQVVQRIKDEA